MNDMRGTVLITDRNTIELTGIKDVESFDEYTIVLKVDGGSLTVEGEALKIGTLDLEKGKVTATGLVCSVYYSDTNAPAKSRFPHLFGKRD